MGREMVSLSANSGVLRDKRGAIYVEFLIAFLPIFVFFLCMLQLSLLFAAKLMVEHATVQGARAAAVVFGDEPTPYGETTSETNKMTQKRRRAVRDAVLISMAPLILDGSVSSINVAFPPPDQPGGKGLPESTPLSPMTLEGTRMVRVRVEAQVVCKISIANAIACSGLKNEFVGFFGLARVIEMSAESVFPYQGASYVYEER